MGPDARCHEGNQWRTVTSTAASPCVDDDRFSGIPPWSWSDRAESTGSYPSGVEPTIPPVARPPATPRAAESVGRPKPPPRTLTDRSSPCPSKRDGEGCGKPAIRVLLVNELPVLVEALAEIVSHQRQFDVIGTERGSELFMLRPARLPQIVEEYEPDVVLINCTRGNVDWTDTIAELRDKLRSVKIAVMVMRSDPETLRPFAKARAVGSITAETSLAEYLRAIHRIHAGEVLFPPDVLLQLLTEGRRTRSDPTVSATAVLGSREREVLQALAIGLSTEEVADRLGITVHTVRTHLKNVLVKVHAHSKLEAVMIALRSGL